MVGVDDTLCLGVDEAFRHISPGEVGIFKINKCLGD